MFKTYKEFHCEDCMYHFIKKNKDNIKEYKVRKYYSLSDYAIYYILEFIKINEDIEDNE